MKRVTGCEYEAGSDIPILLMVDGVDRDDLNKSYPYERVIHAKWIKNIDYYGWHCSVCKKDNEFAYLEDDGEYELQDYFCPHCGADMRSEEE